MSEVLSNVEPLSDAELISRVRGGDTIAYGELFTRHVDSARRLGRQLANGADADDLVSDAFARVLQVLQNGGGPDVAFRAYLLTAVRRLHVDRVRAGSRLQTSDDMSQFDPGVPFQDTAVQRFESVAAAKAFASLPERWQLVLWHLEVERQRPADVAPLLGMSANSVSALAYRAREGLRQAFLSMHSADTASEQCRWTNDHLGAYIRKGLSRRDTGKVKDHIQHCRRCTAVYLELTEVNSDLSAIIAPLLLGTAATGYVATAAGGAATATGLLDFAMGRVRDVVVANAQAAVTGAVAAGVAGATVAGVVVVQGRTPQGRLESGAAVVATETPGAYGDAPGGEAAAPSGASGATSGTEVRKDASLSGFAVRQGGPPVPLLPAATSSTLAPGVGALLPTAVAAPATTPGATPGSTLVPTDLPSAVEVPTATTSTGQPGDVTTTPAEGGATPAGTPTGDATTGPSPTGDPTPDSPTPTGNGTPDNPTPTGNGTPDNPTPTGNGTPSSPPAGDGTPTSSTSATPTAVAADFSVVTTASPRIGPPPFFDVSATVDLPPGAVGGGTLTFTLSTGLGFVENLSADGCVKASTDSATCEVNGEGTWTISVHFLGSSESGNVTATIVPSPVDSDPNPDNNIYPVPLP
jgi:RNA polymerase sigma factor (sigma-70 family)